MFFLKVGAGMESPSIAVNHLEHGLCFFIRTKTHGGDAVYIRQGLAAGQLVLAGRMPVGPVGKARPVYLPNSTVLALASVASKSTVNHTGLPVAFKVHKPTLWSALPQLSMNLARSTSLCLKTALLLLVELAD